MTKLKNYRVRLTYLYSDVVEVQATTRQEAIELAQEEADEKFECFYDAGVEEF
jgi:hypothetical protein